ncbi:MAG: DUF3662 and FHA domain-containing protein [Chloroflexi bacterium]|nr:DUF3662 and FHA domain-containing protein [Chloroflexota bacterium]MCL5108337.1 DUF3662 and FHA domain-containing protein [Chloroflexota bacterium]
MRALERFEAFIESLLETPFAGMQGGSLQPVQIANLILREMEGRQAIGPGRVYVPNRFSVVLSPQDHGNLTAAVPALSQVLATYAADTAAERGWSLMGAVEVEMATDPALHRGRVRVRGQTVATEGKSGEGVVQHTQALDGQALAAALAAEAPPAQLLMLDGSHRPPVSLSNDVITIGRALDNGLVLEDPSVSRHHAEIRRQEGGYVLVDLESSNGSAVNGRSTPSSRLRDGDRLRLGGVELLFRIVGKEEGSA